MPKANNKTVNLAKELISEVVFSPKNSDALWNLYTLIQVLNKEGMTDEIIKELLLKHKSVVEKVIERPAKHSVKLMTEYLTQTPATESIVKDIGTFRKLKKSTTKLQAAFRGGLVRAEKAKGEALFSQVTSAVNKIKAAFRGKRNTAVVKIQRAYRAKRGADVVKINAAGTIQKAVRSHQLKKQQEVWAAQDAEYTRNGAASAIQKAVRKRAAEKINAVFDLPVTVTKFSKDNNTIFPADKELKREAFGLLSQTNLLAQGYESVILIPFNKLNLTPENRKAALEIAYVNALGQGNLEVADLIAAQPGGVSAVRKHGLTEFGEQMAARNGKTTQLEEAKVAKISRLEGEAMGAEDLLSTELRKQEITAQRAQMTRESDANLNMEREDILATRVRNKEREAVFDAAMARYDQERKAREDAEIVAELAHMKMDGSVAKTLPVAVSERVAERVIPEVELRREAESPSAIVPEVVPAESVPEAVPVPITREQWIKQAKLRKDGCIREFEEIVKSQGNDQEKLGRLQQMLNDPNQVNVNGEFVKAVSKYQSKITQVLALPEKDRAYGFAALKKDVQLLMVKGKAKEALSNVPKGFRPIGKVGDSKVMVPRVFTETGKTTRSTGEARG